jgi:hypothetical protein
VSLSQRHIACLHGRLSSRLDKAEKREHPQAR